MTFDEQVQSLRGLVVPRKTKKTKADCTPEEWAARLDHSLSRYKYDSAKETERKRLERIANPEHHREQARARYKTTNGNGRNWAKANRDKVLAIKKSYRQRHPDRQRDYQRAYRISRLVTDASFRLRRTLRRRLWNALSRSQKAGSAVRDLGCTIEELWGYLESQFQPGMTRENLGVAWELDHIYPISKANLQNKAEFLAVNNWRNLQPLTPADNAAKKDKVTPEAQSLFDSLVKEFGQRSPSV